MWIKVCGNTNLDDCLLAAEFGADAVGFVFAAGKRTVTPAQVGAITPYLPASLEKIGVFTTGSFQEILSAAQEAGLTGVQLHGAFAPSLLAELRAALPAPQKVLQVLHWDTDSATAAADFEKEAGNVRQNATADALLVDTRTRTASGGTGQTFDWQAARATLAQLSLPVIVAGGLHPGNVAVAIRTLRPWGIDVASGVEASPGRKDPQRVAAFLANARGA